MTYRRMDKSRATSPLAGKEVAVLGIGRSGMAITRFLASQGACLTCLDRRPLHQWDTDFRTWAAERGIIMRGGEGAHQVHDLSPEISVVSPGVPPYSPMVKALKEQGSFVIGDLALSCALWQGRLAAVTGTNGKTTTTLLLTHLLQATGADAVAAGNISPPLAEPAMEDDQRIAVLEISSFQLEYFPEPGTWPEWLPEPRFKTAVWLNLAPDHLDRHPDMAHYGAAKAHLFHFLPEDGLAVVNMDIEDLLPRKAAERTIYFNSSLDKGFAMLETGPAGAKTLRIRVNGHREARIDLEKWRLLGTHNLQNLAAAAAAAIWLGADPGRLDQAASEFNPPEHRLQPIATFSGITFVDDSKATNVAATVSAVGSLDRPVVLIAGGSSKNEEFAPLANLAQGERDSGIKAAVLLGQEAERIAQALQGSIGEIRIVPSHGIHGSGGYQVMKRAVETAAALASPGDYVLLSPACASFDLYTGYADRAKAFREAVEALLASGQRHEHLEGVA